MPVLGLPELGDDTDDGEATGEFAEESADGESAAVELVEESVEEALLGSASAIPGLLVIATPSPSATANAPTRPTQLAQPIVTPCWMGIAPTDATPETTIGKGESTECFSLRRTSRRPPRLGRVGTGFHHQRARRGGEMRPAAHCGDVQVRLGRDGLNAGTGASG